MHWIEAGCDYTAGKSIYFKVSKNKVMIDLFTKYSTKFYQDKLYNELIAIKVDYEQSNSVTPVEVKASVRKFDDLPDKIRDMEIERSKVFKDILDLRNQLKKLIKIKTKGSITMGEAVEKMEEMDKFKRLKPFSITFVTYNHRSGTGGEVLHFPSCYLRLLNNTGSKLVKNPLKVLRKQPNHWKNATRNFEIAGTGEIRKFHIWLMIEFNGMEVIISHGG